MLIHLNSFSELLKYWLELSSSSCVSNYSHNVSSLMVSSCFSVTFFPLSLHDWHLCHLLFVLGMFVGRLPKCLLMLIFLSHSMSNLHGLSKGSHEGFTGLLEGWWGATAWFSISLVLLNSCIFFTLYGSPLSYIWMLGFP